MAAIRKRELKDGSATYEARIHRRGHPDLSKSFRTMTAARAWAAETEAKLNRGEVISRKAEKTLFSEAVLEFRTAFPSMSKNEEYRLDSLTLDLGEFAIASLTNKIISKYLKELAETRVPPPSNKKKTHYLFNGDKARFYAPATIRKLFYQLKKVVEWHARIEQYVLDPHAFSGHAIPAAWSGQRDRRLEAGEEEGLYASARKGRKNGEEWQNIIGFAIETAMRTQEILKARWTDLNEAGRTLNIPAEHVKTRTFRQIPLSKRAMEILKAQKALKSDTEDRIFHAWKDSLGLGHGFKRLCHRADIQDLKFHDLRHEATSRFFEKGRLGDMQIMKITGHTDHKTLERYVKLRPSELAELMD